MQSPHHSWNKLLTRRLDTSFQLKTCWFTKTLHGTAIYAYWGGFGGQCRHIWQSHGVSGIGTPVGSYLRSLNLCRSLRPIGGRGRRGRGAARRIMQVTGTLDLVFIESQAAGLAVVGPRAVAVPLEP